MEGLNLDELVGGYKERMQRLALMESLVELDNMRKTDNAGMRLDMRGLGMLTLLFFFERRISRLYKTSAHHLAVFIQEMTMHVNRLDDERAADLARDLITVFRPASGKRKHFKFFNWETRESDVIEYSILKDNGFDVKTNKQYYALDEDGLELIFATKEFYSEFQISIHQLLLKQQIKKGEFQGALRQIREMDMEVEKLQERLGKVRLEILRSIASEETLARYKKLLEDTIHRLEMEDVEFRDLRQFIIQTYDTIHTGNFQRKEEKAHELYILINRELEAVHYKHTGLLELTADLRNTAIRTAQESLYYTGVESFNFDKDLVSMILSRPFPPDAVAGVVQPFLKVEQNASWSPLAVFWEQQLRGEKQEGVEVAYLEAAEHEESMLYRQQLIGKYSHFMEVFLQAYSEEKVTTLEALINYIDKMDAHLLDDRDFYGFWLLLHQRSPVRDESEGSEMERHVLSKASRQLGHFRLTVKELEERLSPTKRFTIQNMEFELEVDQDGIR